MWLLLFVMAFRRGLVMVEVPSFGRICGLVRSVLCRDSQDSTLSLCKKEHSLQTVEFGMVVLGNGVFYGGENFLELELLNQLQQVLQSGRLVDNQLDQSWWRFHNSGRYSVHSFLKKVYERKGAMSYNTSFAACVWKSVAPPKAELLLWFILRG